MLSKYAAIRSGFLRRALSGGSPLARSGILDRGVSSYDPRFTVVVEDRGMPRDLNGPGFADVSLEEE
jgi:hypothetical protein